MDRTNCRDMTLQRVSMQTQLGLVLNQCVIISGILLMSIRIIHPPMSNYRFPQENQECKFGQSQIFACTDETHPQLCLRQHY